MLEKSPSYRIAKIAWSYTYKMKSIIIDLLFCPKYCLIIQKEDNSMDLLIVRDIRKAYVIT